MTREEAICCLSVHSSTNGSGLCTDEQHYEAKQLAIKALELQKSGEWLKKEQLDEDGINTWWWYECSECGKQPLKGKYGKEVLSPFCPFCGAKMEDNHE